MSYPPPQSEERRSVERFLEAIVGNAREDADRVAGHLKAMAVKPLPPPKRAVPENIPFGPLQKMLLNLAAALRLRDWEGAGLTLFLEQAPSSASALAAAADPTDQSGDQISRAVFRLLIEQFAHDGAEFGADVLLRLTNDYGFLDQFAAFLLAATQTSN